MRPTKYRDEYCQMLIEHQKQGLSFISFAAVVKVNIDTLYEWSRVYPKFSEARKLAASECLLFWERMGIDGAMGKIEKFSAASFIFNMKNRFRWSDRQEVDAKVENTTYKVQIGQDGTFNTELIEAPKDGD